MIIARGFIVALVVLGAGWPAAAQADLDEVRGLYAAAEYKRRSRQSHRWRVMPDRAA